MLGPHVGLQVSNGVHKLFWFPSPARTPCPNLLSTLFCPIKSFQRQEVLSEGRILIFLRVRNPVQIKLGVLWPHVSPVTLQAVVSCLLKDFAFLPNLALRLLPVLCLPNPSLLCKGPLCPRSLTDTSTVPTSGGGQEPRSSCRIMALM